MALHSLAYYITSHGYGHGVRSCCIIRALNRLYPDLKIHVVSQLPSSFLSNQIGTNGIPIRAKAFDIGMVQIDSIRVDLNATFDKAEHLRAMRRRLMKQEISFLSDVGIEMVVADLPSIPIEAADTLGMPAVAVGNFGWDWIYSEFASQDPRWEPIVQMFREQYAKSNLLLRLPFHEEMKAFPRIQDIPLVATPGRERRSEIAALCGCDEGKRWILLSFTMLDWNEDALSAVEKLGDYEFLTVLPLAWQRKNIYALDREQISFSDVIASVDAVISKPGFGIVSDCIVNNKPLIYADRTNFLEYPILVDAIQRYLRNLHIPAASLYRGDLQESLAGIWTRPEPKASFPQGGDILAARSIASILGI